MNFEPLFGEYEGLECLFSFDLTQIQCVKLETIKRLFKKVNVPNFIDLLDFVGDDLGFLPCLKA